MRDSTYNCKDWEMHSKSYSRRGKGSCQVKFLNQTRENSIASDSFDNVHNGLDVVLHNTPTTEKKRQHPTVYAIFGFPSHAQCNR